MLCSDARAPRHLALLSAAGRTYRYWQGEEPLYPFGYGLSYVDWQLEKVAVEAAAGSGDAGGSGTSGGSSKVSKASSSSSDNSTGSSSSSSSSGGLPTAATLSVTVRHPGGSGNGAGMAAEASVLLFMRYLGPFNKTGASSSSSSSSSGSAASSLPTATIAGSGCARKATRTDLAQRLVAYKRTGKLQSGETQRLAFTLHLGPGSRSSWAGFGDPEPPCGRYGLFFGPGQPDVAEVVLE